jgi:hypothetical protein
MGSTYRNHKQLTLSLKMANRFIAYILANEGETQQQTALQECT